VEPRSLTDDELAAQLADEAGRLLLELQQSGSLQAKDLGQKGDEIANAFLRKKTAKAAAWLAAYGLSIRSTALGNMAKAAPIGQCTLLWQ
jgi:hypothetical protein